MRVGMGYDVHKLVEGRDLILGGVKILTRKDFLVIRMQMYYCMRSWMHFLGRRRLEISESTFRIPIRRMRERPA